MAISQPCIAAAQLDKEVMFKFNFDIGESEEGFETVHVLRSDRVKAKQDDAILVEDASKEISLDDLLSALPPAISFSPLEIPLSSERQVLLSRRDLFDARFQLISQAEEDAEDTNRPTEVEFVDAPSDLVPGIYEGGLKTWECSFDLVDCLDSIYGPDLSKAVRAKRIIEVGCGTAVPSLYMLQSVFSSTPTAESDIHIHLQDYNELVLRLVTLPNVFLAWYMSPASSEYRSTASTTGSAGTTENESMDADALPPADPTQVGELPVSPALVAAFRKSLKAHGVHLKFFSGSWGTFDVSKAGGSYDVLLTSETIYSTASLGSLVDLMRRATADQGRTAISEDGALKLSLTDAGTLRRLAASPYLCLVAAKLVYFGVGGGVNEFVGAVERSKTDTEVIGEAPRSRSRVETIWERSKGVKRRVMRVVWETT